MKPVIALLPLFTVACGGSFWPAWECTGCSRTPLVRAHLYGIAAGDPGTLLFGAVILLARARRR